MSDTATMQCMEVWGGNQAVDSGVVMAGLDAWVYSRPYAGSSVGGDIHYVSSCATGRITRMLVADVSGHGANVSQTAMVLRSLMRRYVNYIDQTRFVEEMNQRFTEMAEAQTFATAVVATFFAPTGLLSVSNAGHPPLMRYSSRTRRWSILESGRSMPVHLSNMPLGVIDATRYDQFDLRLNVGDFVLCYTDSLIEARDADGNMLGPAGLLELLCDLAPSDGPSFIAALLDAIRSRDAANLADDDVTVMLIRPNGMAPRVPLARRLCAPFRILGGIIQSLRPGGPPMPLPELTVANIGGAMVGFLSRSWRGRSGTSVALDELSATDLKERA